MPASSKPSHMPACNKLASTGRTSLVVALKRGIYGQQVLQRAFHASSSDLSHMPAMI